MTGTTGVAVTVNFVRPLIPALEAMIVLEPGAMALRSPFASMVATAGSLEVQVKLDPGIKLLLESAAVAVMTCVVPITRLGLAGVRVTLAGTITGGITDGAVGAPQATKEKRQARIRTARADWNLMPSACKMARSLSVAWRVAQNFETWDVEARSGREHQINANRRASSRVRSALQISRGGTVAIPAEPRA
jgi:hypothetical protein